MINGFVVDIINNTNEQKEICLFKEGGIPEDVLVHVINNPALDLNYLLNIARIKGFMGSGLQVDTDLIDHLVIHDEENVETIGFKNVYNETNLDCGCLTHEKYFIFLDSCFSRIKYVE